MARLDPRHGLASRADSLLIGTNDLHGLGRSTDIEDIAIQMRELVRTHPRECA